MRALPTYEPLNLKSLDPYNMLGALQLQRDTPSEMYAKAQQLALNNQTGQLQQDAAQIRLDDLKKAEALDQQFRDSVQKQKDSGQALDSAELLKQAEQQAWDAGDIERALRIRNSSDNYDQEKAKTIYSGYKAAQLLAESNPQAAADVYNQTVGRYAGEIQDGNILKRPAKESKATKPPFKVVYDASNGKEILVTPSNWNSLQDRINQGELTTARPRKPGALDWFIQQESGQVMPTPTPAPTPDPVTITRRINGRDVKFRQTATGGFVEVK